MRMPIHERMKEFFISNNLSRKAIAANMRISESQLSLMLNGKRNVYMDEYLDFCNAVAVKPCRFFDDAV